MRNYQSNFLSEPRTLGTLAFNYRSSPYAKKYLQYGHLRIPQIHKSVSPNYYLEEETPHSEEIQEDDTEPE